MDYLSFFKKILVPEEPIGGLEISDSHLRLVLLSLDKKTGLLVTREYFEQPLEAEIIINGEIKDAAKLSAALVEFKKNLPLAVDYVVASIPADKIYTKILSFPKNIEGQKLNEAIKLAIDFQFPYPADSVYSSWEITTGQNPQKVFVAEAPIKIIDPYIESIRKAFNLIALEFHAVSFARIAALEKGKTILLKISSFSGNDFSIIKDKLVDFSRALEHYDFPESKLPKESEKIINFYESASGEKISAVIDLGKETTPISEKINFPAPDNGSWLIALGAAERGIIPRQEDNFVSLSPISAQKAYKYHKAVSFASIITKLTVGLSIFFTAAFLGAWILMFALQEQSLNKKDNFSSLPSMIDLTAVEQKIQNANSLISNTAAILDSSPRWSILIGELQSTIIDGITINSLSLPSAEGTIALSGVAANRPVLNQFRDKLRSSGMLQNVNLPLTNLEQKADIPFSISFELKNPQSLYLH